jgi:hypothetical protein
VGKLCKKKGRIMPKGIGYGKKKGKAAKKKVGKRRKKASYGY